MAGHPSVKKRQKEAARKERRDEKAQKRDQRRGDRQNATERVFDEFGNPVEPVVELPPEEEGVPQPDAPAAGPGAATGTTSGAAGGAPPVAAPR